MVSSWRKTWRSYFPISILLLLLLLLHFCVPVLILNGNCFVSFSDCLPCCHPFHACPNPFNIASTSYGFASIIILPGCMVSRTSGLCALVLPPNTGSDINRSELLLRVVWSSSASEPSCKAFLGSSSDEGDVSFPKPTARCVPLIFQYHRTTYNDRLVLHNHLRQVKYSNAVG